MIAGWNSLSVDDKTALIEAPVYITILIGAADNNLDDTEKEWGERLTHFRSITTEEYVQKFYEEADKVFHKKLLSVLASYETKGFTNVQKLEDARNSLKRVNQTLSHLDEDIANNIYNSLLSFAKHIAKVSGGILHMGGISPEEKELLDLKMIDPPRNTSTHG